MTSNGVMLSFKSLIKMIFKYDFHKRKISFFGVIRTKIVFKVRKPMINNEYEMINNEGEFKIFCLVLNEYFNYRPFEE